MSYLSAQELSDMIGCKPNSYACMRRWLAKNNWPFERNIVGFPKVDREYHRARLSGHVHQAEAANASSIEPDFSMFNAA